MDNHRKKQITITEKKRFVQLWLSGLTCNAIANQTGFSATTISKWVNRWRLEGHVNERRRGVRRLGCVDKYPPDHLKNWHPRVWQGDTFSGGISWGDDSSGGNTWGDHCLAGPNITNLTLTKPTLT